MNDQVLVLLDQIDANPYQPRQTEDEAAVQELADSIIRNGLLQVPTARKVDGRYQLAFGHTRLAAFRLLATAKQNGYVSMPLIVRELSDLQMFEMAVAENIKRRDLNPIEQAEAMRVYMDQFEKNSVETGAFFNVSPETVRGTVRLNDLAPEAKEALRAGRITIGTARTLLSVQKVASQDTIAKTLKQIEREKDHTVPEEVISEVLDRSDDIVQMWSSGHRDGKPRSGRNGWLLDMKNFPNKLLPALTAEVSEEQRAHLLNPPACTACPFYTKVHGDHYCGVKLCHERKTEAWLQHSVQQTSSNLKIPIYQESDGRYVILGHYEAKKLFESRHAGLRVLARSKVSGYPHQWLSGIDSDIALVVATGAAIAKMSKNGASKSGHGKKTEKEKQEMRMMRVYRVRRKELLWEFTAIAKSIFDGVPVTVVNKLKRWHFVGIDDKIPDEWKTGKKETAEIKADFERRELLWALTHDVSSHYRRRTMADILKDLQKAAADWDVKVPKSLIKQAEDWDAEIKAAAAGNNGRAK